MRTEEIEGRLGQPKDREHPQGIQISGSLIARNTVLNLIGQALPLMVAVIAMPFVVRGLGTERFGLLSLAWVVMGYFTIFDLGLGRATTKFVAEALGKEEGNRVSQIIWTAVTFQAILGLAGTLALFGIANFLVEDVLNIPTDLVGEAIDTFHLLALAIPVVLISSSFSGVMEAAQRFDLINAVKIPASALTYLLPLVGLSLGFALPGIVILILLTRIGILIAFILMSKRFVSNLGEYSSSFILSKKLFTYGGWITISNFISPILVYLDRFLIGSILTMSAVAYYTAPYEAVTRLAIISVSLITTLFPAFSALESLRDWQKLSIIFFRALKYILLSLGPVIVVIGIFSEEILKIWLGTDYSMRSTAAMQLLALGVLINSLALAPYSLLQGIGRPDITAKLHMLELPIYIGIAWLFVGKFGIAGAAGAWTIRMALDAFLLFWAAFKVCQFSPHLLAQNGIIFAILDLAMLSGILYGLRNFAYIIPFSVWILLLIGLLASFTILAWNYVLDDLDRGIVHNLAGRMRFLEFIS